MQTAIPWPVSMPHFGLAPDRPACRGVQLTDSVLCLLIHRANTTDGVSLSFSKCGSIKHGIASRLQAHV